MRIQRFLEELCILKHRVSSTENEHRAADHIYQLMRSLGLIVRIDEFKSQKRYIWELVTITFLFFVQAALYFISPTISIVIGLTGLSLFWGHFTTRFKPLAPLFRFSKSRNIEGQFQNSDAPLLKLFLQPIMILLVPVLYGILKMFPNFVSIFFLVFT